MARSTIGDAPKRREDEHFVTGRGQYLDDLSFDGLVHAVVLRSTHAHARLVRIDVDEAREAPGVLAVLTSEDVACDGLQALRPSVEANVKTGAPFAFMPQPLLASGKVRYVGEPLALIVAETRDAALDASELIGVAYEPIPALVDGAAARTVGAPEIADGVPGNVCLDWETGDATGVAAAIARAAHVVTCVIDNHRVITSPMEPRGGVGFYDADSGRYTLHVSSQNIHGIRDHVARSLDVSPAEVRLVAPDVGGNFGAKNFVYAEHVLLLWAARRVRRPVKWIATRSEVFLSDHQARDQTAKATLALDAEGRFLALHVESTANAGAYLTSTGAVQTFQYVHLPGTVYRIPAIALRVQAVLTNTAPVGVTRGPGFAEAVNIIERLIDTAARQTGLDRFELRQRNMTPADAMPMVNAFGETVDSGTFPETLERALSEADVAGFPERRQAAAGNGLLRGLGLAYHIKGTGGSPHENAEIRFEADGTVSILTGTQSVGQGHATTFPQILAERLGLDNDVIRFSQGDTDLIAIGGGSGSSRSTYMGGTALWRAADGVIEKGRTIAARMLDAAPDAVEFNNGYFTVPGTNRSVALLGVAAEARRDGTPLDTYHRWTREWMTFPNGAHVVEIEIDPETGALHIDRYTAVDDYGVLVNPMIVAGQAHGAIAQGIGQSLMEQAVYDAETCQPLTGSFMDYALPRADDVPPITLAFNGTPCTTNPLGVKGCGEAGAIAAFPAIINAIGDALAAIGANAPSGAATPCRIWQAIRSAKG
jgi:aerobic carbon-monoxide dehydrogenase large subunit